MEGLALAADEPEGGGAMAVETGTAGPFDELYRELSERRRATPVRVRGAEPGVGGPGVTLYRYEDCARVLRDPVTFSSGDYVDSVDRVMGRTILSMADPEHRRHRELVTYAFRQRSL